MNRALVTTKEHRIDSSFRVEHSIDPDKSAWRVERPKGGLEGEGGE